MADAVAKYYRMKRRQSQVPYLVMSVRRSKQWMRPTGIMFRENSKQLTAPAWPTSVLWRRITFPIYSSFFVADQSKHNSIVSRKDLR